MLGAFPLGVHGSEYLVFFLLFLLSFIVFTGGFFILLSTIHAREGRSRQPHPTPEAEPEEHSLSYTALVNLPQHWVAVQGVSVEAVVNALQLRHLNECSWTEGLLETGQDRVFIAPRIGQWTLILGDALPDPANDVDHCFRFLSRLSSQLGHVQFFSANRALGFHAWAKFYQGRAVRAYAWAGRTVWNQGPKSSAEIKLGAICHDYFEDEHLSWQEQQQISATNIELIPALAARWSIDPANIDADKIAPYPGISGELN